MSPLNSATGLGIVAISFAMAVGQFTWGAAQPIFGAIADRYGAMWVIVAGGIMLAIGTALTPFASSQWMLLFTLGVLASAGAGAGSFSILIGATARHLPPEKRAFAAGFINAGGSFGQFLFAPLNQVLISSFGWVAAMLTMAATALATLPLARMFRRKPASPSATATAAGSLRGHRLRQQLRIAARDKSYWYLHAGFSLRLPHRVPGHASARRVALADFPLALPPRRLPSSGLPTSPAPDRGCAGQHVPDEVAVVLTYFTRALAVAVYLPRRRPRSPSTLCHRARLHLAVTVPPTAGLVGKLFGTLSGHAVRSHVAVASDRRILRAWLGVRAGEDRQLCMDVVCRHRSRARRRIHQSADRGAAAACRAAGRSLIAHGCILASRLGPSGELIT